MGFDVSMNDFRDHISTSWKQHRNQPNFSDVTLACENKQIKAHKVVLSAMSPVLKNLLEQNPHQHPLIYLKGVKFSELFSILDYMYYGEVTVAEDQLEMFLSTAKDLEIQDLSNVETKDDVTPNDLEKIENSSSVESKNSIESHTNDIKKDDLSAALKSSMNEVEDIKLKDEPISTDEYADIKNEVLYKKVKYACDQCEYRSEWKIVLKRHRDARHLGTTFPCDQCEYVTNATNALGKHKRIKHLGIRYPCDQCDYKSKGKYTLKMHKLTAHDGVRYPCTECDYSTTEKGQLNKHSRIKHEGIRYPCSQCNYQAPLRGYLKTHVQKVHKSVSK